MRKKEKKKFEEEEKLLDEKKRKIFAEISYKEWMKRKNEEKINPR